VGFSDSTYINNTKVLEENIREISKTEEGEITLNATLLLQLQPCHRPRCGKNLNHSPELVDHYNTLFPNWQNSISQRKHKNFIE